MRDTRGVGSPTCTRSNVLSLISLRSDVERFVISTRRADSSVWCVKIKQYGKHI